MIIEHGIPIPERYSHSRGEWHEVLSQMEPGDSIAFENEADRDAASMAARRMGMAHTTRKVDNGYRLWRTD